MKSKRPIFTVLLIALLLTSCNLPGAPTPLSVDAQAATIIAATLQEGARNGADVPITATFSPIPPPTQTSTPSGPTATITPTFSTPVLTVLEQTNCRTGPGQDYEVTFTYLPNAQLNILGRYDAENYWLVKSDESPNGQCWIWGEYTQAAGSYWVVPSVTPPPTATPSPPEAPSIQKWDFFCNSVSGEMTVTLTWTDRANNETGYRVYRNNQVIAELTANSTSYSDAIPLVFGETTTYIIEAYNITGGTQSTPVKLTC